MCNEGNWFMGNNWVIDIRHWLDENENPAAPQLKKKVEKLKEIIAYETSMEAGTELFKIPRCWRRPKRKPCPGSLLTITEESPSNPDHRKAIFWRCPECEDTGTIYGWERLICDMSEDSEDNIHQ